MVDQEFRCGMNMCLLKTLILRRQIEGAPETASQQYDRVRDTGLQNELASPPLTPTNRPILANAPPEALGEWVRLLAGHTGFGQNTKSALPSRPRQRVGGYYDWSSLEDLPPHRNLSGRSETSFG
jgi:hypothetical protein